jgi:hypothetical protein
MRPSKADPKPVKSDPKKARKSAEKKAEFLGVSPFRCLLHCEPFLDFPKDAGLHLDYPLETQPGGIRPGKLGNVVLRGF